MPSDTFKPFGGGSKTILIGIASLVLVIISSVAGIAVYLHSREQATTQQRAEIEAHRRAFEREVQLKEEQARARMLEAEKAFNKAYQEQQAEFPKITSPEIPDFSPVAQSMPLEAAAVTPQSNCLPTVIRGNGDIVVNVSKQWGCRFATARATGKRNFIVKAFSSDGESLELIYVESAPYSGQKSWNPGRKVYDHIEVTANGAWSIDVR